MTMLGMAMLFGIALNTDAKVLDKVATSGAAGAVYGGTSLMIVVVVGVAAVCCCRCCRMMSCRNRCAVAKELTKASSSFSLGPTEFDCHPWPMTLDRRDNASASIA